MPHSVWHDFDLFLGSNRQDGHIQGGRRTVSDYWPCHCQRPSARSWFISQVWNDAQSWQYDDFVFGTNDIVPEPSSLLALSAFGAGMFGFIKRRRA